MFVWPSGPHLPSNRCRVLCVQRTTLHLVLLREIPLWLFPNRPRPDGARPRPRLPAPGTPQQPILHARQPLLSGARCSPPGPAASVRARAASSPRFCTAPLARSTSRGHGSRTTSGRWLRSTEADRERYGRFNGGVNQLTSASFVFLTFYGCTTPLRAHLPCQPVPGHIYIMVALTFYDEEYVD